MSNTGAFSKPKPASVMLKRKQFEIMNRILYLLLVFAGLACNDKNQTMTDQPNIINEKEELSAAFSYLALGDSYTIGESVDESERFPIQLAKRLTEQGFQLKPVKIVAKTGWTTDELAEAIEKETLQKTYNLVTLLIGVNNQYRGRSADEYQDEFRTLLQTAIKLAGYHSKNVIVVSIPDYGVTPFGESRNPAKIASEIDLFNRINLEETQKMNARYAEITTISKDAANDTSLIANDGLHPSAKMYKLWVDKMLPLAKEILENQ